MLFSLISALLFGLLPSSSSHPRSKPPTLPEMIDRVRGGEVEIDVLLRRSAGSADMPSDPADIPCFQHGICVAGSGFIVNDKGTVVTAAHVMDFVQWIEATLTARQIRSQTVVSIQFPNVESEHLTMSGIMRSVPFEFSPENEDVAHDIAVLTIQTDTLKAIQQSHLIGGPGAPKDSDTRIHLTPVTLDDRRPRDGEEVFLCGYPLAAQSLTTTSGHVATAWSSENLMTAQKHGSREISNVFVLDLNANAGNSGGPVFRQSNLAVLGILVESHGSLATAVPARYITDFLKRLKIPWNAATSQPSK